MNHGIQRDRKQRTGVRVELKIQWWFERNVMLQFPDV